MVFRNAFQNMSVLLYFNGMFPSSGCFIMNSNRGGSWELMNNWWQTETLYWRWVNVDQTLVETSTTKTFVSAVWWESLLLEEVSVQCSVRRFLHGHLQHLHTFLQPGVSCAEPGSFKSLHRDSKWRGSWWRQTDVKSIKLRAVDIVSWKGESTKS